MEHATSDANYQADPAAQTNAVYARLPAFWPANAKVWFIQAEAQFTIRGISQDATIYYCYCSAGRTNGSKSSRPTVRFN